MKSHFLPSSMFHDYSRTNNNFLVPCTVLWHSETKTSLIKFPLCVLFVVVFFVVDKVGHFSFHHHFANKQRSEKTREDNKNFHFFSSSLLPQVESVELALKVLDGCDVRGKQIEVQRAQFEMKGEYNPALKPKMKKADKQKIKKMQEKWVLSVQRCEENFFFFFPLITSFPFLVNSTRLFDWRPDKMRGERGKHERTVVIKNLFTPELFDQDVQLIIDYQNELRDECGKCGTVRKVVVYDVSSQNLTFNFTR